MRWSLGSTALLLALAVGTNAMAAEPADPAFGEPVARPAVWSSRLGLGFLSGNHVRPVSMGTMGGEVAGSHGYEAGYAAAVDDGYVFGPGSCDYRPPCVDHLWDGYVKRPRRCLLGHHGGHGFGACGPRWSYNGLGAGCGCGIKLGNWFSGHGCADACEAGDCNTGGCGDVCDSPCGGLFGKLCGRQSYNGFGSHGIGHGFKHGGLGRFWASCFGNDCGCGELGSASGCADSVDGGSSVVVPGSVGPAEPIERQTPTPAQQPEGGSAPALELDEGPVPPAPKPDANEEKEATKRSYPSLRGFGSFGLK